ALPAATPPRVRELLRRCLAREPSRRLARMSEARRELETALDELSGEGAAQGEAPAPAGNLPSAITSFVGRAREREQVRERLAGSRLVTLVGPGGCGKTRLALEVAGTV